MIHRNEVLDELIDWIKLKKIKIINGPRRIGKTTLVKHFIKYLENEKYENIIYIDLENEDISLLKYFEKEITTKTFVFIDEIQIDKNYLEVIDKLHKNTFVDLYLITSTTYIITESFKFNYFNAIKYFHLTTFTFKEYFERNISSNRHNIFKKFLICGGFPILSKTDHDPEKILSMFETIYNNIVVSDFKERQQREDLLYYKKKANDFRLLNFVSKFLCDNVGGIITSRTILDTFTEYRIIDIKDYIKVLVEEFLFYEVTCIDVNSFKEVSGVKKYYPFDHCLTKYYFQDQKDPTFMYETIVYIELLSRGYVVNFGKIKDTYITFVCYKQGIYEYITVAPCAINESIYFNLVQTLQKIKGNYKKTIILTQEYGTGDYMGVEVVSVFHWLTKNRLINF